MRIIGRGITSRGVIHQGPVIALAITASFFAVSFFAVSFLAVGCKTGNNNSGLNPGDRVPDVEGLSVDSSPVKLSAQNGKVILLNFWATWCGPCVSELPALEQVYEKLKGQGFTVVGVAINDSPEDVAAYRQKFGLTFPIIIDPDGVSKKRFDLKGVPESFFLDGDHQIILIPDPEGGEPVTRIVGPRDWSNAASIANIEKLLR